MRSERRVTSIDARELGTFEALAPPSVQNPACCTATFVSDVLHDQDLAEVILDRVLERGQHIILGGRSYRTRNLDPETLPSNGAEHQETARESGNTRQPERA
jgi:hypothetical protein